MCEGEDKERGREGGEGGREGERGREGRMTGGREKSILTDRMNPF